MIDPVQINALLNVATIEELWDLHTRQMAAFGFDRLIYGYTRYRTATSLGDPDDFVLLSNHCHTYTDAFVGDGLYFDAPMVRWALENDGACSWSVLHQLINDGALSAKERKVVDFNLSHEVTAGYSISFKSVSPRAKGAIALTARPGMSQADVDALWQHSGEEITALNNLVHLRILSLPYTGPGRALTSRQREVLGWVGDGKTVQDIALLMGLTTATVEKHLRLARQALCVETTAQAILKVAFQNQIFILDH
ncbi:LuxR family transcriptional regulator [uncultured Roseovarius sp.]|uniref:LuxR family transcriptional regulator n=1 Tax=uncultured Roseovarius sp. TaxID=293344 RepID=UPI00262C3731|nr:LuxR family transcriptional regulator [uncultured Roseovarius sp.]